LQEKRFKTRVELAKYLDITPRAQERWCVKYEKGGIKELLFDTSKKLKSRINTSKIHDGLSKRVNSSDNPFLGY